MRTQPDQQTLNRFELGHQVGDMAKRLFPGGVEIEFDNQNYDGMITQTRTVIDQGAKVIYEAAFRARGVFIMADILVRNADAWDLYEVKASTGVKPYHSHDVALQWYALSGQLTLGKAYIVHVDNAYRRAGELDPKGLLAIADTSETVVDLQPAIEANLAGISAMLDGGEPAIPIGPQCNNPFECDFKTHCWAQVPSPSVFDLYNMRGDKKFELFHQGLVHYQDVQNLQLSAVQAMQVKTALRAEAHVDAYRLGEFIAQARYPINFLDFETLAVAIPKYDETGPYQAIPFQYSLHILHQDGELEHREFLALERADPRAALVERLVADVSETGSIVAFNKSFEQRVIRKLAGTFDAQQAGLLAMNDRFIDLIDPFRQLMYYHPDFNGSFSIKSVLPAMFPGDVELDYARLEIREGQTASDTYANLDRVDDTGERDRIRSQLIDYCRLDTLAMVAIWRKLAELAS